MSFSTKLNVNANCFDFEITHSAKSLEEFFYILFISWRTNNVDSIISSVNLETIDETDFFFKQLFINIYHLSLKSETNLNTDNVICAINTLDTFVPEVLMLNSDVPDLILNEYEHIKIKAFQECFKRIRVSFQLVFDIKNKQPFSSIEMFDQYSIILDKTLKECHNVLLILSRLSRIRYHRLYLFKLAEFLWNLFIAYRDFDEIRRDLLLFLSLISDQLVQFLFWKVDCENNELAVRLTLEIVSTLKSDLINCKFNQSEISYVLNILDHHGRFMGKFDDAVPENWLENGVIFGFSISKSTETDEVYDDYEKFLLDEFD